MRCLRCRNWWTPLRRTTKREVIANGVVKIDKEQIDDEKLMEAAEILRAGGLVAFPTETVYGLGANALNEEAAKKS